jgi:hypothetical protein
VPAVAQFPEGKAIVISTPRFSQDLLATLVEQATSGQHPQMRYFHATTAEMNPLIQPWILEQERERDPDMFAREYEAKFLSGVGAVWSSDLVREAVRKAPDDRPALAGEHYTAAIDAAGGTGDAFTLAIGHRTPAGRVIVDRMRSWTGTKAAPVQIDHVLDEVALDAAAYNSAPVAIDNWASQVIKQQLVARGVAVLERPWTNESKAAAASAVSRVLHAGNSSCRPARAW